jgi:ribosomal protein L16 Arg81 hydroxylase
MSLYEEIKKAKSNTSAVVIKNYFVSDISWEDVLNFLYKQASIVSKVASYEEHQKRDKARKDGADLYGDISMYPPLWIKSQTGKVWEEISQLKDYIKKLNEDNQNIVKYCTCHENNFRDVTKCGSTWHLDGIIISLAKRRISEHKDLEDSIYLQMLGKSFWKIKGQEENDFILNPGDLIFVPNEASHEVWGEGPRSGLLLASRSHI